MDFLVDQNELKILEDEILNSSNDLPCPSGYLPNFSGKPVRHALDLSLLPESLLVNINVEFTHKYYLPIYNESKKRISFLTSGGQCKHWNIISQHKIVSRDPKTNDFDREFFEANPQIPKNQVKIYDFREDEGGLSLLTRKFINGVKKIGDDFEKDPYQFIFPTWLKITLGIVIIGGVVYYMPKKRLTN